jgi:hypothetical protein
MSMMRRDDFMAPRPPRPRPPMPRPSSPEDSATFGERNPGGMRGEARRQGSRPMPPAQRDPRGMPTPSRGMADRRMAESRPVPMPQMPQMPSRDMREFNGGGQLEDILGMIQGGMLEGPMGGLQEPVNQFLDTPMRDMGQYMPLAQLQAIMQMLQGGGQGDMRGMGY